MQSSRAQLLELLDGGTKENTFEAYLKRTFCAENLYFYRKVISYESLSVEMETERKKLALEIWNKFVAPDSEDQVNLDGSIVDDVKKNLEEARAELFERAKNSAFKNMWNDSLSRFFDSPEWKDSQDQNEQIESKSEEKTIQIDASPKTRKRARSEVDVSLIQPDSDQPLKKRLRNYVTPVRRLKETPVKVTKAMDQLKRNLSNPFKTTDATTPRVNEVPKMGKVRKVSSRDDISETPSTPREPINKVRKVSNDDVHLQELRTTEFSDLHDVGVSESKKPEGEVQIPTRKSSQNVMGEKDSFFESNVY